MHQLMKRVRRESRHTARASGTPCPLPSSSDVPIFQLSWRQSPLAGVGRSE
ncbi:hypothetical protein [Lysobacter gummosus]|uniref:hypothetical protein n=1 Tax=Lysobacter gummosus TaxID=262324 RepID=UPI00363CC11A